MPDKNMHVLVVDDISTMRRFIRSLLRDIGFANVEEAEDGRMALHKLKNGDFGLVFSDWNMPGMTGMELLKAIRTDAKLKELPFVMITSESKRENIMEAVKVGANGYIVKPFTAAILEEKMGKILQSIDKQLAGKNPAHPDQEVSERPREGGKASSAITPWRPGS